MTTKTQNCVDCGRQFVSHRYGVMRCQNCQKIYANERKKEMYRLKRAGQGRELHSDACLVIEYDPLPVEDGGFRKGALLPSGQINEMLAMESFSTGTVFLKGKNRYCVEGDRLIRL